MSDMQTFNEFMQESPLEALEVINRQEARCKEEIELASKVERLQLNSDFKAFLKDQDAIALDACKNLNHANASVATGSLKLLQGYASLHEHLNDYRSKAKHGADRLKEIELKRQEVYDIISASNGEGN
jgi:uncharacterized phage infection (PIP) family protein YhgE